ncbi:hypothetical protein PT974_06265 [Cladobotryum mycophilum]|uniref:Myb-like DNA-binding domain protein n=1 Tax=Cladobotryum mycophilum TaxID=491253 RepID=A0ABR0SL34_9HYPO
MTALLPQPPQSDLYRIIANLKIQPVRKLVANKHISFAHFRIDSMTSEPPSKRRRKGQSPMDDSDEEEDDDELVFQPFEIEAKRDPGYKFSIERAYSDHRFQATMAHIFDKYGRDFEGIGDEIDLMTGEIVVNNGHVRNMRNEGDVGNQLDEEEEEEEEEEEDEGILLEDLTDGEDNQGLQDNKADEDSGEQGAEDENEEDSVMHGHQTPHNSTALVPAAGFNTPAGTWGKQLPGLLLGGYGTSPFGFGTSPLEFGSPPFAFAASPFPTEPWDIPGSLSEPSWGYPPVQTPQSAFAGHRYKFKAQEGQSSIWAPRSRYKENEDEPLRSVFNMALGKHLARSKTKSRKSLPAPAASQRPTDNDEDDDDDEAILSGKPAKEKKQLEEKAPTLPSTTITMKTMMKICYMLAAQRGRKRKRNTTGNVATERDISEASFIGGELASEVETSAEQSDNPRAVEELGDRRRSGRMRKQVEFLNKISWAEALAERRSQKMRIEIPSVDPHSRNDYQTVETDDMAESEPDSLHEPTPSALIAKIDNTQKIVAKEVIPDSEQNSSQEFKSTQEKPSGLEQGQPAKSTKPKDADSACVLSDDEAPVVLSKRRGPGRPNKVDSSRPGPDPSASIAEPSAESETVDEDEQHHEVADLSTLPEAYDEDGETQEVGEEREETSPTNEEEDEIPECSTGDVQASYETNEDDDQHHEPDQPEDDSSNSTVDNGAITETEEILDPPPPYPSDAAPFSSSPTRALTRFTAEVSLSDKPVRLSREVRWLRTKAAAILSSSPSPRESLGSPDMSGSLRKRRGPGRPRKSVNIVKRPEPTDEQADSQQQDPPLPIPSEIPDSTQDTAEEAPVEITLPSPRRTASPAQAPKETPSRSPSKPTPLPLSQPSPLPNPTISLSTTNPQTPRHRHRLSTRAPSSRRSILSLLSDNEDDAEIDELGRNLAAMPKLLSSGNRTAAARRIWKSSARTTEVYHTPVKKRPHDPISPGSLIRTPGGSTRACGLDGYRCGRDFCFTCL